MRTGTAYIKTGVDTAKHLESGGILNIKMCPDIYTWVGTLHIATSGESAYYSVSGGTLHMKSCSNVHTGVGTQRKIQSRGFWGWLAGWLAGLLALTVSTVPILASSSKLKLARFSAKLISNMAKNVFRFSY